MINLSLLMGCVPQGFDVPLVKPLLTKQSLDPAVLASSRPVFNLLKIGLTLILDLSTLSQIFERIVLKQVTDYLQRIDSY